MISAISSASSAMSGSQIKVDVTANNIANINTNEFNYSQVGFSDNSYNKGVGSGSSVSSIDKINTQGPLIANPASPSVPSLGNAGIFPGFLEGSNTDLTREIPSLIVGQRTYESNASTIKTADEMFGTLLNIKQ